MEEHIKTYIASANFAKTGAIKDAGWCDINGVKHAWIDGPTLTSMPPISTRMCANCGKVQHLRHTEPQWQDR